MAVLTVILVFLMFAHPELRLLAPVVDSLGLDMLIALTSVQLVDAFSTYLKPQLLLIHERHALPLLEFAARWARTSRTIVAAVDFSHSLLLLYDPAHWLFGSGFIGKFVHNRITFAARSGENIS